MFLSDIFTILDMIARPKNWKFLLEINTIFRKDESYSLKKAMRFFRRIFRKEKIVKIGKSYIVNSLIPPFPSRALKEFIISGGNNPLRNFAYTEKLNPLSVYICITDRCQYSCLYCSAKNRDRGKELSTEKWKKIIAGIQDMGTGWIGFTGGEPLMREDLEEIISSVTDKSSTILFTNGKELSFERASALKKSGLFALSVSLDSPEESLHNRIRGDKNAYAKALEAVKNSRRAGLYTIVQSVIFKKELTAGKIFRLCKLAKKHGAHEIRLHQPAPTGKLFSYNKNKDICFDDNDRKTLVKIQHQANRKWFGFPKVSSFPYSEGPEKFGCNAGIYHSYITASGELFPCDFIPISFGSLVGADIKEMYNRMKKKVLVPKKSCWCVSLYEELKGKHLPLSGNEAAAVCRKFHRNSEYPELYKALR